MDIHRVDIEISTRYIPEASDAEAGYYRYAYTITMTNQGKGAATLQSRHWIIDHGNGSIEEVMGDGVVGEYPHLKPGASFTYSSGTVIRNSVGTMSGSYIFIDMDGVEFEVEVPEFSLVLPHLIH